jgi:hypothetical protein
MSKSRTLWGELVGIKTELRRDHGGRDPRSNMKREIAKRFFKSDSRKVTARDVDMALYGEERQWESSRSYVVRRVDRCLRLGKIAKRIFVPVDPKPTSARFKRTKKAA